jgi:hypothetical protein
MQKGCQRAIKSSLSPRALVVSRVAENGFAAAGVHVGWPGWRSALLMLWWRLTCSSLCSDESCSDESFTGRPLFLGSPPPASSCRQGLPCRLSTADRIRNRPDRSAGLLHFRVCRSVAVSHRFGTARAPGGVPTLRPCERPIRGSDRPAAHAGLCLFNRVHREKTVPP